MGEKKKNKERKGIKVRISWPKAMRSFLVFLVLALFFVLFIHTVTALNQDLGRHLKTGEIIWQSKQVPKINLYSYTEPKHVFLNHHWLAEVIYYGLEKPIGISGLVVFNALVALAAFGLVFKLAWRRNFFLLSVLASFLSIGLIIERTDIRPEIFGFLFLALYFFILDRHREKIGGSIWWLLPIQFLWVNIHITFGFGLALFFFFFLDRLWARRKIIYLAAKDRKIDKYIFVVILIGILLGAVSFINPNGWRGALYPLFVFGNYGYTIVENQSPFFLEKLMTNPAITFFKTTTFLLALGFLLNFRRFRLFHFLTAGLFVLLSWSAIRNFPLLGLAALPVMVENFSRFRQDHERFFIRWSRSYLRAFCRFLTAGLVFAILVISIYSVVSGRFYLRLAKAERFGLAIPPGAARAVDFLKANGIAGRMFNNFDIGSYLIWRLYPEQKVFVDGRPEAYSEKFLQSVYIAMQYDVNTWQKYADEIYGFDYVFFAHTDGTPWGRKFLEQIAKNEQWALVYLDPTAAIWLKQKDENRTVIEKYRLDEEKLEELIKEYREDRSYGMNDWLHLGSFFQATSQEKLAILSFERALEIYPYSKQTFWILGVLYGREKETQPKAIEYLKRAAAFDDEYVEAYLALGKIYYQWGEFSEARRAWQRVLEIDKTNQQARLFLDNMGLVPFTR